MKKLPPYIFIFILILSGILTSCRDDDQKDRPFKYINLEFYELKTHEGGQLYFDLSSMETFPCSNFSLDVILNQQATQTEIRVIDIIVPDNCITSLGPATQVLSLGALENGSHKFHLWVNDKRHEFHLNVDEHKIAVQKGPVFQNSLIFKHDSILRVPPHTVWGFISYDNPQVWEDVKAAFESAGADEMDLANGYYYFFEVKNGKIEYEEIKQSNDSFYYKYDKPIQQLIDALEQVLENHQRSEVQLRLFTASGQQFIL
jgi:hypothetical protein